MTIQELEQYDDLKKELDDYINVSNDWAGGEASYTIRYADR